MMQDVVEFLSSWPAYEAVIFAAGMLAGYGLAWRQRQQRRREREKRKMRAHARKVASGGLVGAVHAAEPVHQ
jgi:preprotein translocase subunit YajC